MVSSQNFFRSRISALAAGLYTAVALFPIWMNITLVIIPNFFHQEQAVLAFFEGLVVLLLSWIPLLISLIPGLISLACLVLLLHMLEEGSVIKKLGAGLLFAITVVLYFLGTIMFFSNMSLGYIEEFELLYGAKVADFLEAVFSRTFKIVLWISDMTGIK